MSTRCIINFAVGEEVRAKIFRNHDGKPDAMIGDLQAFFAAVEELGEHDAFTHAERLAARFVAGQAAEYEARRVDVVEFHDGQPVIEVVEARHPLAFVGLAVVLDDPVDCNYRYFVDCRAGGARPALSWDHAPALCPYCRAVVYNDWQYNERLDVTDGGARIMEAYRRHERECSGARAESV